MKNQSKNNLPWTFTFINASGEGLYYSYVLNSKQIFYWIPSCLLRSVLISGFLHENTKKMSFFYTTICFDKYHKSCFSNILTCPIWLKLANMIRKYWVKAVDVSHSGIHEVSRKKPRVQWLHSTMHSGFWPYIMIYSSPFNQNLTKRS